MATESEEGNERLSHPRHQLDETIHQPVRLSILALLAQSQQVDFAFIQSYVELGESNLSRHLSALEAAGYIKITKVFEGKKPRTWISLTASGREAFTRHVSLLRQIVGEEPVAD